MKVLIVIILLLSNTACSQDARKNIVGKWVLESVESESIYECPDVIIFNPDHSYKILNDCYGDMKYPVIEEGF